MIGAKKCYKKYDVHQEVTDRIIEALEAGTSDFQMPWHSDGTALARPVNARSGRAYNGVNLVSLWAAACVNHYSSNMWATYRQWSDLDAQVRKGQKASVIVFYKEIGGNVVDEETGESQEHTYLVARASRVFNADQVTGWEAPTPAPVSEVEIVANAEAFVSATGAMIWHSGAKSYYEERIDLIQMPDRARFTGTDTSSATESYYAILLHELTHWTGHENRLNRDLTGRFGDEAYAMEELVAELGAAFLCTDLSLSNTPREDHAAYIASWLKVFKEDKKAVFTAASKASQAAEYLASFGQTVQNAKEVAL